jgi:hypothetical protein
MLGTAAQEYLSRLLPEGTIAVKNPSVLPSFAS